MIVEILTWAREITDLGGGHVKFVCRTRPDMEKNQLEKDDTYDVN